MVWVSGQSALSSAFPGLVPGYVDMLGWLLVVQREAAASSL